MPPRTRESESSSPSARLSSLVSQMRCPRVEEFFADQLARTPDAPAVVDGACVLTYAEVERLAQSVSLELASAGVAPGDLVGIMMERSARLPAVVLGVLRAGAAYVPLDPAFPMDRLSFMIREARLETVLADRPQRSAWLPASVRILTPPVPGDAPLADAGSAAVWSADELAYVVFTSGSTGRPKGVAMTHRPLSRLVAWHRSNEHLGPAARTLQFAPLSFDVSFQEIFTTWAAGGCLVTVDEVTRRDPFALLDHLLAYRIERIFLPFVALEGLCSAIRRRRPPHVHLRDVVTAGEQLRITPTVREVFTHFLGARLHNHFGPSETHLVTAHTLDGEPAAWPLLPPIGRAVAGAELHILDESGRPVRPGAAGELFIGGEAVSAGYLNQPELTGERFRDLDGLGRVYQTGDWVRADETGVLKFLGRLDGQAKIRGYRVEPGEVEAAVSRLASVARVAVVVEQRPAIGPQLVAYVVPADGETDFDAGAACRELAAWLPDHMLPGRFVLISSLPVTPSGKVDRLRLQSELPPLADGDRDVITSG